MTTTQPNQGSPTALRDLEPGRLAHRKIWSLDKGVLAS